MFGIHDPEPIKVTPEDTVHGFKAVAYNVEGNSAEVSFECTVGESHVSGSMRATRKTTNTEDGPIDCWHALASPDLDLVLFGFQVAEIGVEVEAFLEELGTASCVH